jgi:hypothetical protein
MKPQSRALSLLSRRRQGHLLPPFSLLRAGPTHAKPSLSPLPFLPRAPPGAHRTPTPRSRRTSSCLGRQAPRQDPIPADLTLMELQRAGFSLPSPTFFHHWWTPSMAPWSNDRPSLPLPLLLYKADAELLSPSSLPELAPFSLTLLTVWAIAAVAGVHHAIAGASWTALVPYSPELRHPPCQAFA